MLSRCIALLVLLAVPGAAFADTLAAIEDRGAIRLGVRADAVPFSYKDTLGEPAGYTVQLCRAVAADLKQQLGLPDLAVEYVEVTTEERFDAIGEGRIDLLCGATSVTLGRRAMVDFSSPTFVTGMGVLYRNDGPASFAELAGRKVGVRSGTTTEATLRREAERADLRLEIVPMESHETAQEQLAAGTIDAYFADRAILIYLLLGGDHLDSLTVSERLFSIEPYALALPLGDHAFRLAVDSALSRIYRSEAIERIYAASFGDIDPGDGLRGVYLLGGIPE